MKGLVDSKWRMWEGKNKGPALDVVPGRRYGADP